MPSLEEVTDVIFAVLQKKLKSLQSLSVPLGILTLKLSSQRWLVLAVLPPKRPFQLPTSHARRERKEVWRKGLVILRQFGVEATPG